MAVQLRSTNISLLFDYWPEPGYSRSLNELWQAFRRTAVEPGQASSPDLVSFADECLLCAQIAINDPTPTEENDDAAWGAHALEGYTPDTLRSLPTPEDRRVGLVYLHTGPANLPAGEANIGVIMKQDMRRRGYAREAVQLVLGWAFEELKFHRVQAAILDTSFRDRALRLFIGSGFTHEGTKRRAVYQPEGEGVVGLWKDVTYLAMLDTEWTLQSTWKRNDRAQERPVITAWDEMFARHAQEREELLKWEEKHGRMRRSPSTETLRESIRNAAPDLAYLTDDASSIGEPSWDGSSPPSPRPNVVVTWDEDEEMEDIPGLDELRQQWGEVRRHREDMESASLRPSLVDRMLSLPSIPSTRLSEGNPQSPVSIPSTSTPGSTPPSSPSPSPAPSTHYSWMDSEDEDNWLPDRALPLRPASTQLATPHVPYPYSGPSSTNSRSRSNSVSSSDSSDSWSDAQSSFGANSNTWDIISNTSDQSPREHV